MIKDKLQAFGMHLLFSILIGACLAFVVFDIWYPSPLPKATGITQIFAMMLAIDVILGPILTFLVYKKGKKTLKMDLCIIVLLQLGAMLYGMYFVSQGRPSWLVHVNDRVMVISPAIALDKDNRSISNNFKAQHWGRPKWQTVQFASDAQTFNQQLNMDIEGQGIVYQPINYQSYSPKDAIRGAKNLSELSKYNDQHQVEKVLAKYADAKFWLPLRGTDFADDLVVLLDVQGNVLSVVELNPW